ncbi:protein BNIP5-like [Pseudophryne corroboree]|uniref:protein BNIP5-like n=1 Tax=Pseudophryne corroboree TaxID=495146 RepID=UPI003081774F
MEEAASRSPGTERKVRGKFVSLSKQEAKMVLEMYVKRSFSNRERRTEGRQSDKRVQRSHSDRSRYKQRVKKNKMLISTKADIQETNKIAMDDKNTESNETAIQKLQPATIAKANSVKKTSWFKTFLSHFFKTDDKVSEQNVTVVNKTVQVSVSSSTDAHLIQTAKKTSLKKNSIRRALSLKKNASDEDKKPKRPTHLPLKRINKPLPLKLCEKNESCYYQQVSEEIENLVKDIDNLEIGTRKPSLGEELNTEVLDTETVIKKIVSILQKQGDVYDRKIKEDPTLNNFFRDISYNSFKQLADVYIDKEVKTRGTDATPEDMKFAFSVHFTKQVVGLSTHPANRIMGFGNQYLQDTFTWLSCNMDNVANCAGADGCISPD